FNKNEFQHVTKTIISFIPSVEVHPFFLNWCKHKIHFHMYLSTTTRITRQELEKYSTFAPVENQQDKAPLPAVNMEPIWSMSNAYTCIQEFKPLKHISYSHMKIYRALANTASLYKQPPNVLCLPRKGLYDDSLPL
ncbi:unnamed protein product, partial [Amoebophrya sp. A25]